MNYFIFLNVIVEMLYDCCYIGGSTSHNEPRHVPHCQIRLFYDDIVEGNIGTHFEFNVDK